MKQTTKPNQKALDKLNDEQRRSFVKNTAIASAGIAVTALAPGVAVAANNSVEKTPTKRDQGYQVTPHVIEYYKSAAS